MMRARRNRRKATRRVLPKLPSLPRLSINWRVLSMLTSAFCVLGIVFVGGRELIEVPLKTLELEGDFQRVSRLEVEAAIRPMRNADLLTLDFGEMRARIKSIDWVDTVQLQRIWPDTVRISVTEHVAAARWGDAGLLNTRGELFAEDAERDYPQLPRLAGPPGSLDRVANRYLQVSARMARAGLNLTAIAMDDRGAFSIEFAGGLRVRIGREDVDGRIDRFFELAVPELAGELARVEYLDMRYSNGFAVGWHESEPVPSRLARAESGG